MIATRGEDRDANDTHRLEQIQRTNSPAESRRAGEQGDRTASALAAMFGAITQPRRITTGASSWLCRALPEGEYRNPTRRAGRDDGPARQWR